ncbi:transcriptional regulator [Pleomorphomonas carboxyditropha]|uniref:Transcriptional regulator n=2 Tax=Pleomorphomonas TaxID=261933 RepID=A0A2G9WZ46_9HYPH|nr:transcriptional regulator [Pleomorphomonas carboxyditropha]
MEGWQVTESDEPAAEAQIGAVIADKLEDDDGLHPRGSLFSIGDLAREFDVTLRTLRFYEDKGLISPRREGLNRLYSRRDRARLKLVLMGKRVGFSLTEIKGMLDLYDLRDGQVAQLKVALDRFNDRIAILEKQKKEIEQALMELRRTTAVVSGLLKEKEEKEAGARRS